MAQPTLLRTWIDSDGKLQSCKFEFEPELVIEKEVREKGFSDIKDIRGNRVVFLEAYY